LATPTTRDAVKSSTIPVINNLTSHDDDPKYIGLEPKIRAGFSN